MSNLTHPEIKPLLNLLEELDEEIASNLLLPELTALEDPLRIIILF